MVFNRTTPPNPKCIRAKKFIFYGLCSSSALVFAILLLLYGLSLIIDPETRTRETYILLLTFAFSTFAQCLGIYASWTEDTILGSVHLACCGLATIPYQLLHHNESVDPDFKDQDIPSEFSFSFAAELVFIISALLQGLLMRDFSYLRNHPTGELPEAQIPNPKHTAIKRWILLIGCSVATCLLALGFCALGIYMLFVEPTVQSTETYFFEVVLLFGSACQWVGFLGARYERLTYVAGHVMLCTIMLLIFAIYSLNYYFLYPIETFAFCVFFYISEMISLSFSADLRRMRKDYSTPGNNDENINNMELMSVEQSN